MREIKFRAWDKENEAMQYFDDFWLCGEYQSIAFNLSKEQADKQEGNFCLDFEQEDLSELMQFTGLLDKNGKEIYEGDILIYIKDGEKYAPWSMEWQEFYDSEYGHKLGEGFPIYDCYEVEIIGNIYENKELLNVER